MVQFKYFIFQTNYECNYNNNSKLYIYDNSIMSTINGAKIKYYGSDIFILSSTSIINASSTTIRQKTLQILRRILLKSR